MSDLVNVADPTLAAPTVNKPTLLFMYEYLVGVATDGKLSKDYGLARDWVQKDYPTYTTYTFSLRKGVKWHDGEEFTAEDVKFTIEYTMHPASKASSAGTFRKYVDRVNVLDPYTVEVRTKEPYAFFLLDMSRLGQESGILPKHYIEKNGPQYFNRKPIGTGPYKFKEQVVGSHIAFEAIDYEHWLHGVPKYKDVIVKLVPEESTRVAMLKKGEIDIAEVGVERIKELEAAGFSLFVKQGGTTLPIKFGNTWEKGTYLSDVRVREALSLTIDRESILKNLLLGVGKVTGDPGWYGSWAFGYKPFPAYGYDPKKAKSLLEEAIKANGWDKVKLTFQSFARPGVPQPLIIEAIASMWKVAFGDLIEVKIVPTDYATHREMIMKAAVANVVALHAIDNAPLWGAGRLWVSLYGKGELTFVKDPQLDALLEKQMAAKNIDEYGKYQYEAVKYVREQYYSVQLLEAGPVFGANPKKVTQWDLGLSPHDRNFLDVAVQGRAFPPQR